MMARVNKMIITKPNNSIYNRMRGRGHKAVASHSKKDPKKADSFSRYIPNESKMHHLERKEAILPCGFKVRESWAALRKSWQGCRIAHSEENTAKMKYYAKIIHKVQQEMGIGLTDFDLGLLDDQDTTTTTLQVPSDTDNAEAQISSVADTGTQSDEDILPDFEEIMNNTPKKIGMPNPREEIFSTYEDRSERSCEYPDRKANKAPVHVVLPKQREEIFATYKDRSEKSCEYDDYAEHGKGNIETQEIYRENSCWLDPEPANRKLKKEKKRQLHSCFYKSKGIHTANSALS